LLWIFLAPSVVKIVHKHEPHFHCKAKNEKHFHAQEEKCLICAFQFSSFIKGNKYEISGPTHIFKELTGNYIPPFLSKSSYLSLLLRSPPYSIFCVD